MKNLAICAAISLLGIFATSCKSEDEESPKSASGPDKALTQIQEFIAKQNIDKTKANWKENLPKPPKAEFDDTRTYLWNLDTNKGRVRVKLHPDVAPMHVSSVIYLAELGFYDNLKFHRVITDFMAQGGCPKGTGTGSPGYKMKGEYSPNYRHDRFGLLSAANSGEGTDGSQFFLTFKATPWLDDKHTIYGEVVSGVDCVRALEKAGSSSGKTTEPLSIVRSSIVVE
jgi:cyclophilin family peptidyl-prolyl cis-trans isomerase